ncbi:MAG TPA: hypothetical protein VNJ52_10480 [Patescibacteria group bacterium]|nr:hypothetical protein [Patescibacteria group bacterium]
MKIRKLFRRAEIGLLIVVTLGCIATLRYVAHFLPLHFSSNFEEGNILNAALRIVHGQTPYPAVGGPPYVVNPYGPVFYYALAPLVKWFGVGFFWPRLLVVISGFASAFFLVLLLRRGKAPWLVALPFGLSYLALPLVRNWLFVLRVDLFAVVLVLAGLYVFCDGKRLFWPAMLFVAALYAKVTVIAAPLACFAYLILAGKRRRAWRFAGWMTALGLAGMGVFQYATYGWGFFHLFLTHPDPYRFGHYLSTIGPFALLDIPLLFAVAGLAVQEARRKMFSLPLLYFLLATVFTLTAGKMGSDANHLLEWQAAMCLAAGFGYQEMRSLARPDSALAFIPVGLALVILVSAARVPRVGPENVGCPAAYRFVADSPGQILSQNPGAAVLSGKRVWLSNPFEYEFLGTSGTVDQQPLIRMVQRKFFGVILLGGEPSQLLERPLDTHTASAIWPPQFVSALTRNYRPVARFACVYASVAYEPIPLPKSPLAPAH